MDLIEHTPSQPRGQDQRGRIIDKIVQSFFVYALTGIWDDQDEDVFNFQRYVKSPLASQRAAERKYWDEVWDAAEKQIAETVPITNGDAHDRWQRLKQRAVLDPDLESALYIVRVLMNHFSASELYHLVRVLSCNDRDFWFDGGGSVTDAMKRARALADAKHQEIEAAYRDHLQLMRSDEKGLEDWSACRNFLTSTLPYEEA